MNEIVVVTSANENYLIPLKVMLRSLQKTLKKNNYLKIFILNLDLKIKFRDEIEAQLLGVLHKIEWIDIDKNCFKDLKVNGHISIDTYSRLMIETTINQDKVLYLDADLLIKDCVSKIWNLEFQGSFLFAVQHISKESGVFGGSRGVPSYKFLNIPPNSKTFNAGVMLINLKLWRKNKISEKILNYLIKFSHLVLWWDQDGLNAILYDKWKPLPHQWNVMTNHFNSINKWEDSLINKIQFNNCILNPKIIHFAGPEKPWLDNYNGIFKYEFEEVKKSIN